MSQLILRDVNGIELGRRPMDPSERYFYYRAWDTHELIQFDGKVYLIKTVAWQRPEEILVLQVSFHSWESYCDC